MKVLLSLAIIAVSLFADAKQELFRLYQSRQYKSACHYGMREFHANRKDEAFVSLYAFSCLESDYIDRLAVPASILKYSKDARANAAYFSVIFMQKKMLYHALIDDYDISGLKLPSTDHILSKVFDLYASDTNKHKRDIYLYQDPDSPSITYKLYISQKSRVKKMVIEQYYDTMLEKRHIYW